MLEGKMIKIIILALFILALASAVGFILREFKIYKPKTSIFPGFKGSLYYFNIRVDIEIPKEKTIIDPNFVSFEISYQFFIKKKQNWEKYSHKINERNCLPGEPRLIRHKNFVLVGRIDKNKRGFIKIINTDNKKGTKIFVPFDLLLETG
jgi:hypothetical protein